MTDEGNGFVFAYGPVETVGAAHLGRPRAAEGGGPYRRGRLMPRRGPKGLPYERYGTVSVETVGEGLKVNQPKAERGHPGVCPFRRPVWDPYGVSVRPAR